MPPPNRVRPTCTVAVIGAVLAVLGAACASADDGPEVLAAPTSATETSATETPATETPATDTTATETSAAETTDTETSVAETTVAEPFEIIDYVVEVVATLPHDTGAYTQGLEVVDGLLVESTGVRGESSIRVVDPATGNVVRSAALDDELFGEGATVVSDEVWQLTWTSETVIIHGLDDLVERRRLSYGGEGWGLCATADRLIMSDGSSVLTIRDPVTFDAIDRVQVTDDGEPLGRLNELECVDGLVWANVYRTTRLVAIDPADGRVVGRADLAALVPDGFVGDTNNVANGIANDPETGRFYLTGKRWPVLYEVELVPVP